MCSNLIKRRKLSGYHQHSSFRNAQSRWGPVMVGAPNNPHWQYSNNKAVDLARHNCKHQFSTLNLPNLVQWVRKIFFSSYSKLLLILIVSPHIATHSKQHWYCSLSTLYYIKRILHILSELANVADIFYSYCCCTTLSRVDYTVLRLL